MAFEMAEKGNPGQIQSQNSSAFSKNGKATIASKKKLGVEYLLFFPQNRITFCVFKGAKLTSPLYKFKKYLFLCCFPT